MLLPERGFLNDFFESQRSRTYPFWNKILPSRRKWTNFIRVGLISLFATSVITHIGYVTREATLSSGRISESGLQPERGETLDSSMDAGQSVAEEAATFDPLRNMIPSAKDFAKFRKRKVWYASSKGHECNEPGKRYKNTDLPLPVTQLLSTQGSGNTWLRWLIERVTGLCTGSAYKEYIMQKSGFQCEVGSPNEGAAIVYKSHYFDHVNTTRVLLLVRNPYDALVSDFNRMMTAGNHTGVAGSEQYGSDEWHTYVKERSADWITQIRASFERASELLVVFYENLKKQPGYELLRIAYFLGIRTNDYRIKCALQNSHGVAKRPSRKQPLPSSIFTAEETNMINGLIESAAKYFQKGNVSNVPEFYRRTELALARFQSKPSTA